jgi:hypothetical protein
MGYPKDIKVIDCMMGIPNAEDRSDWFASFRPLIKDAQTLQQFTMPAQYMFKDVPHDRQSRRFRDMDRRADGPFQHRQGAGRLER